VEAETLSCGTGITASALTLWKNGVLSGNHLTVETKGGVIDVIRTDERIYIEGPARVVFVGQYLLNSK
jgi:diaminopimelate epimerase